MIAPVLPHLVYETKRLSIEPAGNNIYLQVVIDTEEEFDWFSQPNRESRHVTHFGHLHRLQNIFERYNLKPCYVVDHPVATDPFSVNVIKPWLEKGSCVLGAHLHPWVNPPFSEELSFSNMYPGNLAPDVEREKLYVLKTAIEKSFNITPRIYKAGRYGFGPRTAHNLHALGFDIDVSFSSAFDMRADGGPNHKTIPPEPFLLHQESDLPIISFPGTAAILGAFPDLHDFGRRWEKLKLPGIFSRLNIADRLKLSPEGFTHEEHVKLTRFLLQKGVKVFSLTLHSSSVMVGGSPYAPDQAAVEAILDRCDKYCDFFFNQLGGLATDPIQLKSLVRLP